MNYNLRKNKRILRTISIRCVYLVITFKLINFLKYLSLYLSITIPKVFTKKFKENKISKIWIYFNACKGLVKKIILHKCYYSETTYYIIILLSVWPSAFLIIGLMRWSICICTCLQSLFGICTAKIKKI